MSVNLGQFLLKLHEEEARGSVQDWLHELTKIARRIWSDRYRLAEQSFRRCCADAAVQGWLRTLDDRAHVYDVRNLELLRGWPYGMAGPGARHHRCGRLRLFAISSAEVTNR